MTEHWDDILLLIGALFLALQGLILALKAIAKILGSLALYTQTKADDDAAASLSLALAQAHDAIERAQRWLPRPRFGKVQEPLVGTSIPPPPERGITPTTTPEA